MSRYRSTFLIVSIALLLTATGAVQANTQSAKDVVLAEAIALCESAANNKYGDGSIKSISKKVKWSKGLKGATVKMKIKQKSKKARKYSCVVSLDKSVDFHKV